MSSPHWNMNVQKLVQPCTHTTAAAAERERERELGKVVAYPCSSDVKTINIRGCKKISNLYLYNLFLRPRGIRCIIHFRASLTVFLYFCIVWTMNNSIYLLPIYFFKYILQQILYNFFILFKYYFFHSLFIHFLTHIFPYPHSHSFLC